MADLHGLISRMMLFALVLLCMSSVASAQTVERYPARTIWESQQWTNCVLPGVNQYDALAVGSCMTQGHSTGQSNVCSLEPLFSPNPDDAAVGGYVTVRYTARYYPGGPCESMNSGQMQKLWGCPYGGTLKNNGAQSAGYPSGAYCDNLPPCAVGESRDASGQCRPDEVDCTKRPYGYPGWVMNPITNRCSQACGDAIPDFSLTGSGLGGQTFCKWGGGWSYCQVAVSSIGFRTDSGTRWSVSATGAFCDGETEPRPDDPDPTDDPNPDGDDRPPSEDEEPLPNDQADCLKRGMTWGQVNGLGMCLPRGTPGGDETEKVERTSTKNPDGSTTETTRTIIDNGDGTWTVVVDVDGDETTTTGDRDALCTQQPALSMCKPGGGGASNGEGEGGSVFGGACASGFTCEGDAIQCAIALEQHKRNCALWAETDASQVFADALAGNDPAAQALDPENRESVDVAGVIDDSGFLSGGCVEDATFSFPGGELTIPFSRICPYLDMMGLVVVAFSMLAAARIIFT